MCHKDFKIDDPKNYCEEIILDDEYTRLLDRNYSNNMPVNYMKASQN